MNFYQTRLFRYRPIRHVLNELLLTAYGRMRDSEQREHIAIQLNRFRSSAARGLKSILLSESNAVVPVGFLDGIGTPDTYVGVTIETMIEMAMGATTPKFSLPLSRLLNATSSSLTNCSVISPREIARFGTLLVILTRLLGHRVINCVHSRRADARDFKTVDPEVVFCIVHTSPAYENAKIIEPVQQTATSSSACNRTIQQMEEIVSSSSSQLKNARWRKRRAGV